MNTLNSSDFTPFFEELWGCEPFPWQNRLLRSVVERGWPECIDLPTASGKTACLDVAVFALALQASLPPEQRTIGRRIFFVVNRRVIVDEAYERAKRMSKKLRDAAPVSVVGRVARSLREVNDDQHSPPIDVALLRGGIVRDNRWARSITQPTIVTSTIDQVGSRLLFRGYGISEWACPLHAALIAHDSLLLLDEAHICQPFVDSLCAFRNYRGERWSKVPIRTPFAFVQMTATPSGTDSAPFRLDADDRKDQELKKRHGSPKPVMMRQAKKAKGKNALAILAQNLIDEALAQVSDTHRNIAIVVNRVATARMVAALLHQKKVPASEIHLAIGRMRPIDRDRITKTIQARVGPESTLHSEAPPMFVVATQCLEVGADFDFDALVTECASLDAMRQRFGRLNRRGRPIEARKVVVVREDQTEASEDPIYGTALYKTWNWLNGTASEQGDRVDFGVHAMSELLEGVDVTELLAPRLNAPVMFPAYVDTWAQTSPRPTPDPDVSLFIHGPQRGEPDVQVCWREDLDEYDESNWVQVVSMCPPSSPECMTVPIGVVRRWIAGDEPDDGNRSDVFDGMAPDEGWMYDKPLGKAVIWRGARESKLLESPRDLRPGDTIVIPVAAGGWSVMGHIPEDSPRDLAERARLLSAGLTVLRLNREKVKDWPESDAKDLLVSWIVDPDYNLSNPELRTLLRELALEAPDGKEDVGNAMRELGKGSHGFECERYPDGSGVVLRTKRPDKTSEILPAMDDGDDRTSDTPKPVFLPDHLDHVVSSLGHTLRHLPLNHLDDSLLAAARMHDWGKADERFQAMLLRGNLNAAWARSVPLAKSGSMPLSQNEWGLATGRCGYPMGFRHEMLSVQLAEHAVDRLPQDSLLRSLALHLIASHHGRGRPFAPVVLDEDAPEVDLTSIGADVKLSHEARRTRPAHRLDSGIAERFWKLTRHYGWWGLAYLEAVVRLADQGASQQESEAASAKSHRKPSRLRHE